MLCNRAFVRRPATAAFSPWRGVTRFFICQGFQESTAATGQELAVHCHLPAHRQTPAATCQPGPEGCSRSVDPSRLEGQVKCLYFALSQL